MAIIRFSGRGVRTAAGLISLLSMGLLLSACWLFPQPTSTGPVNDVVALVADSSVTVAAGTHVFTNDGNGNLSVGPVLGKASSGYTDLALGNLADHAAPSGGGSPVEDIFVTNNGVSKNEVWINDGSGSFALRQQSAPSWTVQTSTAVVLGPILGISGELDALVANGASPPKIWENTAKDGTFSEYTSGEANLNTDYSSNNPQYPYQTVALAMGSLTGSGGTSADVFTGNYGQQNQLYQDLSNKLGTYSNSTNTPTTDASDSTQGVAVGDLDGDGLPDVFVANNGQNYAYFNNNGSGSYNLGSPVAVGSSTSDSTAVAIGDLTGSGTMYAFVVNNGSPDTVWKYNGSDGFTQVKEPSQFNTATDTTGTAVTLADLNGDGILDAMVASGGSGGTIQVWLGNGDGTFTQKSEPTIPPGNYVAVAAGRLR